MYKLYYRTLAYDRLLTVTPGPREPGLWCSVFYHVLFYAAIDNVSTAVQLSRTVRSLLEYYYSCTAVRDMLPRCTAISRCPNTYVQSPLTFHRTPRTGHCSLSPSLSVDSEAAGVASPRALFAFFLLPSWHPLRVSHGRLDGAQKGLSANAYPRMHGGPPSHARYV